MHLRDGRIDRLGSDERDAWITAALREQVAFVRGAGIGFWSRRLDAAGLDPDRIDSLADFARLPPLGKSEYRAVPAWELVPRWSRARLTRAFPTSGTTGRPTTVFWTGADFRGLVDSVARQVELQRPSGTLVALNGYHQAHTAGPGYDAVVRALGGFSVPRHYAMDDAAATLSQLAEFGCNALVLPERSGPRKSACSVADLISHQPDFFARAGIRWWLGSSSTFSTAARAAATAQGVVAATNLYGSSEFGMLAVSCRATPVEYHVVLGHALVEVVDDEGRAVASGKRGRVVVTCLRASHAGTSGPHEGSQLLRLDNGDEATFLDGECPCGLTAPRLRDVGRGSAPV